jgi:hypothetical protein
MFLCCTAVSQTSTYLNGTGFKASQPKIAKPRTRNRVQGCDRWRGNLAAVAHWRDSLGPVSLDISTIILSSVHWLCWELRTEGKEKS